MQQNLKSHLRCKSELQPCAHFIKFVFDRHHYLEKGKGGGALMSLTQALEPYTEISFRSKQTTISG